MTSHEYRRALESLTEKNFDWSAHRRRPARDGRPSASGGVLRKGSQRFHASARRRPNRPGRVPTEPRTPPVARTEQRSTQ